MTKPQTTAGAKRTAKRAAARSTKHKHDALCGCDLDMREDPTPDEELPPASGNVEGDGDAE
jgi:hypothetical protein